MKTHWKSYELKRLGVHGKTAKAILRLQQKEIYANKKFEELKIKIKYVLFDSSL